MEAQRFNYDQVLELFLVKPGGSSEYLEPVEERKDFDFTNDTYQPTHEPASPQKTEEK